METLLTLKKLLGFDSRKEVQEMAVETTEKYCPICGREVKDLSIKRFGEYLCSEEHAEQYVKEVRAKQQAASQREEAPHYEEAPRGFWRRGGCC